MWTSNGGRLAMAVAVLGAVGPLMTAASLGIEAELGSGPLAPVDHKNLWEYPMGRLEATSPGQPVSLQTASARSAFVPEDDPPPPPGYLSSRYSVVQPYFDMYRIHNVLRGYPTPRPTVAEEEEEEEEDEAGGWVPLQIYTQVRRSDTRKILPREAAMEDAESLEEIINAPRLKQVVKHKKIQQVYEEEGYEDMSYDHGGYNHKGSVVEDYDKVDKAESGAPTEVEPQQHKRYIPADAPTPTADDCTDCIDQNRREGRADGTISERRMWAPRPHGSNQPTVRKHTRRGRVLQQSASHVYTSYARSNKENVERGSRQRPAGVASRHRTSAAEENIKPEVEAMSGNGRWKKRYGSVKRENKTGTDEVPRETGTWQPGLGERNSRHPSVPRDLALGGASRVVRQNGRAYRSGLNTEPSITERVDYDSVKYPYYHLPSAVLSGRDSPLRYASDPASVPRKSGHRMEFYESRERVISCSDPSPPQKVIPERNHDGEWNSRPTVDGPRLSGLGDNIRCFKIKFFGHDPLDNPLFEEDFARRRKRAAAIGAGIVWRPPRDTDERRGEPKYGRRILSRVRDKADTTKGEGKSVIGVSTSGTARRIAREGSRPYDKVLSGADRRGPEDTATLGPPISLEEFMRRLNITTPPITKLKGFTSRHDPAYSSSYRAEPHTHSGPVHTTAATAKSRVARPKRTKRPPALALLKRRKGVNAGESTEAATAGTATAPGFATVTGTALLYTIDPVTGHGKWRRQTEPPKNRQAKIKLSLVEEASTAAAPATTTGTTTSITTVASSTTTLKSVTRKRKRTGKNAKPSLETNRVDMPNVISRLFQSSRSAPSEISARIAKNRRN